VDGERRLVDLDDHDLFRGALARHDALPAVEDQVAEALELRGRRRQQERERREQRDGGNAERA
jgi:hypothetical protein